MEKEKYIRSQFSIKVLLVFVGFLSLLVLIGIFAFACYKLFMGPKDKDFIAVLAGLIASLILFSYGSYLVLRSILIIKVTDSYIAYSLPFLPFISWRHKIDYYDKIVYTNVAAKFGFAPMIWLVKKGKLKMEISPQIYKNYDELIDAINLPKYYMRYKYVYNLEYLFYILGIKKVQTRMKIKRESPKDVQPSNSISSSK